MGGSALMIRQLRKAAVAGSLLLLASCNHLRGPPRANVAELPSIAAPDIAGSVQYQIDPRTSVMHVQVLRGGTLASLGHNHVVTSRALTGRIWLHPQLERSGFEISFPVHELVIDDPDARRAAGEEFPPEVPATSREGTRRNMLREEVLDGQRFPVITLRSVRVVGELPTLAVTARIKIKETSRDLQLPVEVTMLTHRPGLGVVGEFDLLQTDFGITPYSVALGALAVQDRLHISYQIEAYP
jgi:polyisoprenoid-binding protein YceI